MFFIIQKILELINVSHLQAFLKTKLNYRKNVELS